MEGVLARIDRLQGQLAVLCDGVSAAEEAFASSLHRFEALQQAVEAARTRLVWGEALLSCDAGRARLMLETALSVFEAAEAWPEVASVRRLLG
jgi:hypothetical protein